MKHIIFARAFLRTGLAAVFLYAAFASFQNPLAWVGFFPFWLREFIPTQTLLPAFSLYEIMLACWLLTGRKTNYAARLAAISLFGIVIFNLGALDIIFRDAGLFFAALALGALADIKNDAPQSAGAAKEQK